jgi:hypothetical protein
MTLHFFDHLVVSQSFQLGRNRESSTVDDHEDGTLTGSQTFQFGVEDRGIASRDIDAAIDDFLAIREHL